jgi:hypothetical protein
MTRPRSEKMDIEAQAFDGERDRRREAATATPSYVKDARGWILFGPRDIRDRELKYFFCLQQLTGQKEPRVRVGCRYYTLAKAWEHWSFKAKTGKTNKRAWSFASHRNEGKQAIAIIRLMLLQAQAYGLISIYATIKFDSPKRKTSK